MKQGVSGRTALREILFAHDEWARLTECAQWLVDETTKGEAVDISAADTGDVTADGETDGGAAAGTADGETDAGAAADGAAAASLAQSERERCVYIALNAAFLVALFSSPKEERESSSKEKHEPPSKEERERDGERDGAGKHPQHVGHSAALRAVRAYAKRPPWADCATQYLHAYRHIAPIIEQKNKQASIRTQRVGGQQALYELFFPEGILLLDHRAIDEQVSTLRQRRRIEIDTPCRNPIQHPAREILFTSNAMFTVPLAHNDVSQFPKRFVERLDAAGAKGQQHWFDHPIPIGINASENEILHGLKGLNEMMAIEKERGVVGASDRLHCLLSASTTHDGLRSLIHEYFIDHLGDSVRFEHVELTVMTEENCHALLEQVLVPLAKKCGASHRECAALREVFGVDGEYGRHYSFLKAIAALWQVCVDPKIKATFKMDLDQVFPQRELIAETGKSALQLFQTPLWGATGRDWWGNKVELSMIAGALVNEADIQKGIFTPDVTVDYQSVARDQTLSQRVFNSKIPQALSTEAEMMERGDDGDAKGARGVAMQRIHVTGGTNGILIDALRRHRPFSPTECGRAEDQAYLLSVLHRQQPCLRYLHRPGLIMRHDKAAFAGRSISKAKIGTQVGDYIRMLFFSAYAHCHSWSMATIKEQFDPFTGAFISPTPLTIAYLRCALDAHAYHMAGDVEHARELIQNAATRLPAAARHFSSARLQRQIAHERRGWECYYHILEQLERRIAQEPIDPAYKELRDRAREIIAACRIKSESD